MLAILDSGGKLRSEERGQNEGQELNDVEEKVWEVKVWRSIFADGRLNSPGNQKKEGKRALKFSAAVCGKPIVEGSEWKGVGLINIHSKRREICKLPLFVVFQDLEDDRVPVLPSHPLFRHDILPFNYMFTTSSSRTQTAYHVMAMPSERGGFSCTHGPLDVIRYLHQV